MDTKINNHDGTYDMITQVDCLSFCSISLVLLIIRLIKSAGHFLDLKKTTKEQEEKIITLTRRELFIQDTNDLLPNGISTFFGPVLLHLAWIESLFT